MKGDNQISLYISIGGFIISCLGFLNTIRQAHNSRRIERLRVYDKIYFDVCDLLLFDFKKKTNAPFISEDKILEKAVNNFGKLHWLEQLYGNAEYDYISFNSDIDKYQFHLRVAEEYHNHIREKSISAIGNQSPVLYLDDNGFRERFERVMNHVKENISFFSPNVREVWEKSHLRTPQMVLADYVALDRVNGYSCEELDERIDDPYLAIFLLIRKEHRDLNRNKKDRLGDMVFNFQWRMRKISNKILRRNL